METPYLNHIAYPAIYPFWLIPGRLETSRNHIFFCPSRPISVISKPKSVKENGCGACDVLGSMQTPPWSQREVLALHGWGGCGASTLGTLLSALAYHIGLELLQWDWKLRMIGNQLHQFANDEPVVAQLCEESQMFAGRAGVQPWSVVGTDDSLFIFYYRDWFLSSVHSCSLSPYLDTTLFLFSSLFFKDAPTPLSPAVIEWYPPSLNADLFCNKTRCVQGQPLMLRAW